MLADAGERIHPASAWLANESAHIEAEALDHNFEFAGYVTDQAPPTEADRTRLRAAYGYRCDERICLVSVGGSGVGEGLLRRVLDAVPLARRVAPELRFV